MRAKPTLCSKLHGSAQARTAKAITQATYGTVDVAYVPGSPYTPYNQLTLEQVNGWVTSALGPEGVAKAEADCDAQIEAQKVLGPVTPPLPW